MSCHFRAFTVTSDPDHLGAKRLAASAKYWGWDLEWQIQGGWDRKSYRAEQLGQLEFFRKVDPDFALYLDAWDTIFAGPPQELQARLVEGKLSFCGDTVLCGWSTRPWAARLSEETFPPRPTWGFPFVNCGVMWGDTKVWKELAEDYLGHYRGDLANQDYFNARYAFETGMGRNRLEIDTTGQVALNIMNVEGRHVARNKSNRIGYLPFKALPLVIHSPGHGQNPLELAPMPHWMTNLYEGGLDG